MGLRPHFGAENETAAGLFGLFSAFETCITRACTYIGTLADVLERHGRVLNAVHMHACTYCIWR